MCQTVSGALVVFTILIAIPQGGRSFGQSLPAGTQKAVPESATILSLVQQSHDLNDQIGVNDRSYLLQRQLGMVSRYNPEVTRLWADELFALSFEQKGGPSIALQQAAIAALAQIDPDHALEMLQRINPKPEPAGRTIMVSPNTFAATAVFSALVARDGIKAIPLVEQEAEHLAINGAYPYNVIGAAANAAMMQELQKTKSHPVSLDPATKDREHAVSLLKAIFDRAYERYSQRVGTYADNYAFGDMLIQIGGTLPPEVIRPALDLLVMNLLTTDTKTTQVQAQVLACDGKEIKAQNAIDAALLRLNSLMSRVDPELTQQLEENRPALRLAVEETKAGCVRSVKMGPQPPPNSRLGNPNVQLQADAMQFAHINADAAIAKVEQISDEDMRTTTMLSVATEIAGDHPDQAQKLITDAEARIKQGNGQMQLNLMNLITAQVSLAASQNRSQDLHDLLGKGFELAGNSSNNIAGAAGRLVEFGMQNDPNSTISFIQNLPALSAKAQLLLAAASALEIQRLPISSQQQQNTPVR